MGCVASAAVIARFPYLPFLRKPDFLWNTLDIAIWSTVEQGLAITASSLATLRPLLKLAAFRLGLTSKPVSFGPSGYRSSNRTPMPGTQNGFSGLEGYTLSSVHRPEASDRRNNGLNSNSFDDTKAGIKREVEWEVRITKRTMNESEEELHSPNAWRNRSAGDR
ncbi:hypothetical protein NW762_013640 [Fusarium torreyae]|uniref:Rhodopsin domain-containing protein n=1 Tax=Fusarium torreyae TaxID=1237075 RepID=A0A9W8RN93_9HYPO|nr:hypothetical protein NW762_013640 [Fusarium torreyae]